MIPYSFLPEAEAELGDAALFYESRRLGLGKSFAAEVERALSLVCQFPDAGSPVGLPKRRVFVARFPYSIVYRRDPELIVVLAIAHTSRRPGYWRQRR